MNTEDVRIVVMATLMEAGHAELSLDEIGELAARVESRVAEDANARRRRAHARARGPRIRDAA
jgi:hypothetical protein